MILLDGFKVATERNLKLKKDVEKAYQLYGVKPGLAFILIGDNPASLSYVKGKGKACDLVGFESFIYHLEEKIEQHEIIKLIELLNQDDKINGIILQLPIPKHLNEELLINLISKDKDADGFHVVNQGNLYQRRRTIYPATPKGIMSLLDTYDIKVSGLNAVVVGRSNIVGFPVARLLMDQGATITICHRQTQDLAYHTKQADIIIACAGQAKLITKSMVKSGAVVIDVGVNRVNGKLVGDVDFEGVKEVAAYLTPVPKGIGPMTINGLLENTFELFMMKRKLEVI